MDKAFAIFNGIIWGSVFLTLIYKFVRSIRLVPTKEALIVERLGKYHTTLGAGFHTMIPFIDRVAFTQDLKEETIDVPPQECFTNDNVKVITRAQRRQVGTGQIIRVGTALENIEPLLLSKDATVVELGLPFLVSIPEGMQLTPGEFVDLSIEYAKE